MYNSDGYVLIDMSEVDLTRSSQNIPGIFNRVVEVIDTNKLALIINAGNNTPMAAIVHKKLNYYVINTTLFIFTINSNDIVIVEEAGEATVDVEIVPTLTEGTKIADFAIGSVEGSLYVPEQQSEINDNVTASNTTWSSDKTAAEIAAGAGVTIDDTTTSTTKTWSSDKINTEISYKPSINDTTASSNAVYSSDKVDTLLSAKADTANLATVATSGSYKDLSNKPTIPTVTVDRAAVGWATTLTTNYSRGQYLVLNANDSIVLVWFASTNDINILKLPDGTRASGSGSVTQGNITYTRNSNGTLTVTSASNTTFSIIG